MQCTSVGARSSLAIRRHNQHDRNTRWPGNKQRRSLTSRPRLSTEEIKQAGKLLGQANLRQAMEQLMYPANLWNLPRQTLVKLHQFLRDRGRTMVSIPSSRVKQGEYVQLLFGLLYPAFPIWRAREQAYRQTREKNPKLMYLAYDTLFLTTDLYEREEEVARVDRLVPDATSQEWHLEFTRPLEEVRSTRYFMYLWLGSRTVWLPQIKTMTIDGKEKWTERDERMIQRGCRYIDLTDKLKYKALGIDIKFYFTEEVELKHVSVCAVHEKTPEELASHVYLQTVMQNDPDAKLLPDECYRDHERRRLLRTEAMFVEQPPKKKKHRYGEDGDEDELVLLNENETISALDPLMISRIEHPARGIYCRHAACFDLLVLFQCQQLNKDHKKREDVFHSCPHCGHELKSVQELYVDYDIKMALLAHPEADKLVYRDGIWTAE